MCVDPKHPMEEDVNLQYPICRYVGLSDVNLRYVVNLQSGLDQDKLDQLNVERYNAACVTSWLLEGVRLTGTTGWIPANKDLSNAKLQGTYLSSFDLSGVNLRIVDLLGANLSNVKMKCVNLTNTNLHRALMSVWRG